MYQASGFGDMPLSLTFINQTNPGRVTNPQVGDSWQIIITGPAGGAVSVYGTPAPGAPYVTTPMGALDSTGRIALSGTFTADEIGGWYEVWSVGSSTVGTLQFTVAATQGSSTSQATSPTAATGYVSPNLINQLVTAQGLDVAGYDIPWWGVAAVVGGLFFLFSGKRR